ncbi:baseplate J/gp47 family protein [Klebsiella quasipneumoniae subsp. similipneumoniae]|uniref:baseplate assembly protein n=1 Tax=Klebsiella pneumoniae complex TaxID=3390273 RepID=UPI0018E3676A|nr:baseplate J/gp47 family protein [Klebsiella variicola]HBW7048447.1 baseplate J/gp47 family protein [Klebsiella pneumoniae]HCB0125976.1 baseplate J/gp47 family protein [Klebsiella variicola subsp. variicola]HBZ9320730.1 baseplate J/gp47 family protein [Klebsiella pneumoniae]HBZ9404619.1 baseplate J/gp47 family protein [Klebsiella pneumoniae]HBZ9812484.1 baseplate J/gp47 family protein [Klebsiella pneumoniae]
MPTIDLSQLPLPTIIEGLDFETILAEVKAVMVAAFPDDQQFAVAAAMALESEPLNIIAQAMAYRELLLRQRINEGAAACMLSHSTGDDLDNIAANLDTERLVITKATDTADAVMESDEALRLRAQAAFEGMSVAGPSAAYEYFARSASGKVADARASSPAPAEVIVAVLSTEGDGTASPELLAAVAEAVNDEEVRPLGDRVTVRSAEIVDYEIDVTLYLYPGPESEPIINAADASLQKLLKQNDKKISRDVARSAISAAVHVQGVQRVKVNSPEVDIKISDIQAARNIGYHIENGGTDE